MAAQRKSKASKFLTVPTRPIPIDRDRSVAGLLEKMEGAGFGAKQLAEAHRIWLDMLDDNSTIYMCGSGNLIPSGMRRLLAYVIKNRFVDVMVMSGHGAFSRHSRNARTQSLSGSSEYERRRTGSVGSFARRRYARQSGRISRSRRMDRQRDQSIRTDAFYSIREFLHLVGRELAEIAHEDGILTAAFKSRVPVFCPDLLQSPLSVGIARARFEKKIQFNFDITQDTMEMMQIAQKTRNSGIITLGSVCSQNMVNMAEISSYITRTTSART